MTALSKIKTAGFDLSLTDTGTIKVAPFSKLTDTQREYLKTHKAEIMAELQAEAANDKTHAIPPLTPTECQNLQALLTWIGERDPELIDDYWRQVESDPAAKAYFLARYAKDVQPKPETQQVKCMDCKHFQPHHQHGKGSGDCAAGVIPSGIVHWYDTPKRCQQFNGLKPKVLP
jgi:hypothetical protein